MDQAAQGQEQALWDAAELTQQQSWDWDAYYDRTGVGRTGAEAGKTMPCAATLLPQNPAAYTGFLEVFVVNHCRAGSFRLRTSPNGICSTTA
jgi:hypothetical protein